MPTYGDFECRFLAFFWGRDVTHGGVGPWSYRRYDVSHMAIAQGFLWVGLPLPLLLSSGQASWLAPAINLVAIPWLSLLTVPRGFPCRGLLPLPFVGLVSVPPPHAPLRMTVLDVGQALAVIVETAEHVLVYDKGARYSEKIDAGRGIIAPFLRRRGHLSIDLLMISHEDNDHSGGAMDYCKACL